MFKTCSKCDTEKPLKEFRKDVSQADGYQHQCKVCARAKDRSSYQQLYGEKGRQRNAERRAAGSLLLNEARSDGCIICKEDHLPCLEFHHLDPSAKELGIGSSRSYALSRLKAEIAKCVVLCSNCHKKVHSGFICLIPVL